MLNIKNYTCVFCLWLFSAPVYSDSNWSLDMLMQALSEVNSLKAEFEEVKTLSIFSSDVTVKGWLNYTRPNYIERQIVSPHRELTIIEDDQIRIAHEAGKEDNNAREQTLSIDVHPAVRTLIESIRATFAGDVAVLKNYYNLMFSGTRENWLLTLEPITEKVKEHVRQVKISGSDRNVTKILTIESDESESEITIVNAVFN